MFSLTFLRIQLHFSLLFMCMYSTPIVPQYVFSSLWCTWRRVTYKHRARQSCIDRGNGGGGVGEERRGEEIKRYREEEREREEEEDKT